MKYVTTELVWLLLARFLFLFFNMYNGHSPLVSVFVVLAWLISFVVWKEAKNIVISPKYCSCSLFSWLKIVSMYFSRVKKYSKQENEKKKKKKKRMKKKTKRMEMLVERSVRWRIKIKNGRVERMTRRDVVVNVYAW